MSLIKFHTGGKFFVPSRICLNYVSKHSVRRKYRKIQKIAKITMTVTKIGCVAPFGIGNISGSF